MKKVFLKISQNLHKNICVGVLFSIKLQAGDDDLSAEESYFDCDLRNRE